MKRRNQLAALALCAVLALSTGAAAPFSDVSADSWYAEAIAYCQKNGLMDGSGATFSPETPMTRAMLITALYQAAGAPVVEDACAFSDVPADAWYAQAARWAGSQGVITGDENGLFSGDTHISRQDAVTIFWRCAGKPEAEPAEGFLDGGQTASYAQTAVDWAKDSGIVVGFPNGRFAPQDDTTCAQAAEMLMRYQLWRSAVVPEVLDAIADMYEPCGIAMMEDGALLISDTYNNVLWRLSGGESAVYAGRQSVVDIYSRPVGGYYDGGLEESLFRSPWAIAPFLDGYAVTDAENNAVRLIQDGKVQTLNCTTTEKGLPATASGVSFSHPTGLAAGDDGCLYVSDTHQNAIRKITPEGAASTFADGLSDPMGLCWKDGTLYAADTGSNRILKIADGEVSVVAGTREGGWTDGNADEAAFSMPQGVAVDDSGVIYVADTGNSAVRRIQDGIVTTLYARDVADLDALYPISPVGLLIADGRLYVCDSFAQKVLMIPL